MTVPAFNANSLSSTAMVTDPEEQTRTYFRMRRGWSRSFVSSRCWMVIIPVFQSGSEGISFCFFEFVYANKGGVGYGIDPADDGCPGQGSVLQPEDDRLLFVRLYLAPILNGRHPITTLLDNTHCFFS